MVSAGSDMAIIREQVKAGIAQLWRVTGEGVDAYVVTRIDDDEWVIVCGEGCGFKKMAPYFIAVARAKGLTIRTHTKRKGIIRMWRQFGLTVDEYVLRG